MNIELIKARSQVVKLVRGFFDAQGFTEMLTPRLVGLPGQEPHLDPFWTRMNVGAQFIAPSAGIAEGVMNHLSAVSSRPNGAPTDIPAALITSPEYSMKKLLAEGLEKIYDLGPCFRNGEPWDGSHDPEFLLLEWYRRDAGIEELMTDTENLIRFVGAHGMRPPTGSGRTPYVPTPFRRLTVRDAMKQYANVDLDPLLDDRKAMARICREHGQTVDEADTWDDLFFKIFLSEVEPKLGWSDDRSTPRPTFLTHYPASMAALARRDPADPRYALRVELYVGDFELANGFAELSDPIEQRKRFIEDRALRQKLGKKTWPLDERFLAALPKMGNAAGIAFGVDRLVILLTGAKSINEILPFPARERFEPEAERK